MADCVHHPGAAAAAPCRTCGRPLCGECRRDVRGAVYCEDCLAARVQATAPRPPRAAGLPNPTLAAFLGLIPGVGAFYNAQYEKGVLHVLMLPLLVAMVDSSDGFFGILIPVYFAYMATDAYKTAVARQRGETPPDYLSLGPMFGSSEKPISAAFGRLGDVPPAVAATADPDGPPRAKPPLAAIVLIVLGVLLLLGNLGWVPQRLLHTYWPVVLIVIGILQGRRRLRARV